MTAATQNPAREKVSWGEVCGQVGFADNLYATCRKKLGNAFVPASPFGDVDDAGELEEDFSRQIRRTAQPIPPPPPEDWEYQPKGFLDELMYGKTSGKILLFGGGAVVVWLLAQKFFRAETTAPKP